MKTYSFQFHIGQRVQLPNDRLGTIHALGVFDDGPGKERLMCQVITTRGAKWWLEGVIAHHNPQRFPVHAGDPRRPESEMKYLWDVLTSVHQGFLYMRERLRKSVRRGYDEEARLVEWERANEERVLLDTAFREVMGFYEECAWWQERYPYKDYWVGKRHGLRAALEGMDYERWRREVILPGIERRLAEIEEKALNDIALISESAPAGLGPDFGLGPGR